MVTSMAAIRKKNLDEVVLQSVNTDSASRVSERLDKADKVFKQKYEEGQGSGVTEIQAEPVKPSRPRVVKETFTLLPNELDVLESIRERLRMMNVDNLKAEVLRAGIIGLSQMSNDDLKNTFEQVEKVRGGKRRKTG